MVDSVQEAVKELEKTIKDFYYNLPASFMDDFDRFIAKWKELPDK